MNDVKSLNKKSVYYSSFHDFVFTRANFSTDLFHACTSGDFLKYCLNLNFNLDLDGSSSSLIVDSFLSSDTVHQMQIFHAVSFFQHYDFNIHGSIKN